ncbi:MAG: hypothetical protein CMJ58_02040 [Planctomycetaceae bacterium]|nr:hypothetical protein [Planctomycetaceae bacterium]
MVISRRRQIAAFFEEVGLVGRSFHDSSPGPPGLKRTAGRGQAARAAVPEFVGRQFAATGSMSYLVDT